MKESIKQSVKREVFENYLCNHLKLLLESSVVGYKDLKPISEFYDKIDNFEKYRVQEDKTDEEIIEEVLSKFKR